jgi:hypothetical protein
MASGEIDCIHEEDHAAYLEELWEEIQTFLAAKQMEKAKDISADLCRFPRENITTYLAQTGGRRSTR